MDVIQVFWLSFIEGFTEFLPVSSTGHLIAFGYFLEIEQNQTNIAFFIIIQLAAILAVCLAYREKFSFNHFSLWLRVCFSFLFLAIVGYIFRDEIKILFSIKVVGIMFIIGGLVFLWTERFCQKRPPTIHRLENVGFQQAFWIGIGQVFSLIPGTSRAGSSIVFGMLAGLDRKTSTEYSFLLALPVMLTVSGYEFLSNYQSFSFEDFELLAIGFVVSFISAYLALKLLIGFLKKFTFVPFAIYRILFGILLLIIAFS